MSEDKENPGFLSTSTGMAASILAPALLGGGAMGLMASRMPERLGEDARERRQRIIRHALAGAVASGGVGGLSNLALQQVGTAIPPRTAIDKFLSRDDVKAGTTLGGGALGMVIGGAGSIGGLRYADPAALTRLKISGGLKGKGTPVDLWKKTNPLSKIIKLMRMNPKATAVGGAAGAFTGMFGNNIFHRLVVPAIQGDDGN